MNGAIYVTRNWRRKYVIRVEGQYDHQPAAVATARSIATVLGVELVVKGNSGRIRAKDSHGNDPPSIPG